MKTMRTGSALLAVLALAGCSTTRTETSSSTASPAAQHVVQPAAQPVAQPVAGQAAPAFRLQSNEGAEVALADMRGRWVVLYFYPRNFTGGCTAEAQNFQRDIDRYESLGAVVVGVSVDSVESHREFCTKEGLTFKLLSDVEGTVSAMYGSLNERNGRRSSARNTFVIDPEGTVARVFTAVNPTVHSAEVLAALEELRAR